MDRLKISIKIGLSFGVVIVLAVIVGFTGIKTMRDIAENTVNLYKHPYTVSTAVLRIDANLVRMHRSMKDVVLSENDSEMRVAIDLVNSYEKKVYEDFAIVRDRFLGDQRDIEIAMKLINDWRPIRKEVISLMESGRRDEAAAITKGKGAAHVSLIHDSLDAFIRFAEQKAKDFVDTSASHTEQDLTKRVIFILINALIGIILVFVIARAIATPLGQLAGMATGISEGDLTVKIPETKRGDEVGVLWNAFHKMSESLREQINQITEGANVLASSTNEMAASVSELSSSSSQTASSVSETTSTVEEVRQTAQIATQKAALVSEVSQKALFKSQTGLQYTAGSINEMANIKREMRSIAESILQLSDQSQAIGDIIASVADIAEQSNLLAVNASIEAVKAGEQGKGFGVVAQEIRRLADQSKQSTFQVRSILNDIQKAVHSTVMATEKGEKAVATGEEKVHQAGRAIEELTKNMDESAQAALQIAASSREQMVGVDQVAIAMENIKQASHQNLAGARQVEAAAKNLNALGQSLKGLAGKYKV